MGEFLSAQRKVFQRSRASLDQYSLEAGQLVGRMLIVPAISNNGTDLSRQRSTIQRLSERLHDFCNDVTPKSHQHEEQKHNQSNGPNVESPPTYEEAMRLINQDNIPSSVAS